MAGVSKSFFNYQERQGLVLGIIRAHKKWVCKDKADLTDYVPNNDVNQWVEVPIYTHLHLSTKNCESRNHINALTSSEVELALQYGPPG